jgi:hypothetical protein
LLVAFDMNLEGVCHELHTEFHYEVISALEGASCERVLICLKRFETKASIIDMVPDQVIPSKINIFIISCYLKI